MKSLVILISSLLITLCYAETLVQFDKLIKKNETETTTLEPTTLDPNIQEQIRIFLENNLKKENDDKTNSISTVETLNDAQPSTTAVPNSKPDSIKLLVDETSERIQAKTNIKNSISLPANFVTRTPSLSSPKPTSETFTKKDDDDDKEPEAQDVQFFEAPLVTAFTVHQDASGLPNRIVPLYKQAGQNPLGVLQNAEQLSSLTNNQQFSELQLNQQNELTRQQLLLKEQQALEESKQKYEFEQRLRLEEEQKNNQFLIQQQQAASFQIQPSQSGNVVLTNQNALHETNRFTQSQFINNNNNLAISQQNQQTQINNQYELEEKQRTLEKQLREIQEKRQRDELLRQQLLYQQQQLQTQIQHENAQRQQLLEQRQRELLLQQQRANNFNNQAQQRGNTEFEIQRGIPIQQILPYQELPNKEAVDFLRANRGSISTLPLEQAHVPNNFQRTPTRFPLNSFNNAAQGSSLSTNQVLTTFQKNSLNSPQLNSFNGNLNPLNDQSFGRQSTRVFRQESGVGNFGFNNNVYNNHNTYYNRNNVYRPQRFAVANNQLKSLLYQSGIIRDRPTEDLNIVSKVLSLNHLGGDYEGIEFRRIGKA